MSKKTFLKILSCVLTLVMLTGSVYLMPTAFAEGGTNKTQAEVVIPENIDYSDGRFPVFEGYNTIVFNTTFTDWTEAYLCAWTLSPTTFNAPWPGVEMNFAGVNDYEENQFVAYVPEEFKFCEINDGKSNGARDTIDFDITGNLGIYTTGETGDDFYLLGYWSPDFYEYDASIKDDVSTPDETVPTENTTPEKDTITIYYENTEDWDEVYCHAWSEIGKRTTWPGILMQDIGDNIFKAVIDSDYTSLVFNDGTVDAGCMSPDLYIPGDNMLYSNGVWSLYEEGTTDEISPASDYIYFYNSEAWDTVYAHCYGGDGESFGVWPGTEGIDLGDNIWAFKVLGTPKGIIFNDYNSKQTNTLPYVGTDKIAVLTGSMINYDYYLAHEADWAEFVYSNPIVELDSEIVTWNDGSYNYHNFKATVTGGTAPYTYQFIFDNDDLDNNPAENEANVCIGSNGEYYVEVVVTDSQGYVGRAKILINVDIYEEETIPKDKTYTIYFRNHDNWYNVYAYTWCDDVYFSQPLGQWPGTACEYIDDDIWAIEVTDNFDYIMFNCSGKQTNELPNPGGFNIARWVSTDENRCEYMWEFPVVTDPTETTMPTELPKEDVKVYFDNSENYEQVFAYAWGKEDYGTISQWPGVLCTNENNGTWSVEIPGGCGYVLFHNGNGVQTNDLVNPEESKIAKVIAVEDGYDVYDWFDIEEITTSATDPTEEATTESKPLPTEATEPTAVTEPTETATPEEAEPTEVPTTEATEAQTNATEPSEEVTTAPATFDEPETTTPDETEPSTGDATTAPTDPVDKGTLGDVTDDGKVNIKDVTQIQKYAAKIVELTDAEFVCADVNADSKVNVKDATAIQKFLAKIDTGLPIEKPVA